MQTDEEKIGVLETMGEAKVRFAIENGMLVWHLVQPAHEWLAEIDRKNAEVKAS